jgi:hypothetical protein
MLREICFGRGEYVMLREAYIPPATIRNERSTSISDVLRTANCRPDYTHITRVGEVAAPSRRSVEAVPVLNSGASMSDFECSADGFTNDLLMQSAIELDGERCHLFKEARL